MSGDVTVNWNLQNFSPAPSARLLEFSAYTKYDTDDIREVTVIQPFIIRPSASETVTLPLTVAHSYDCEAPTDFPKIAGDI